MKNLYDENPELAAKIMSTMENGNALDEEERKSEALAAYEKAWELLPPDKLRWDPLSAWVSTSLYNLYFDSSDFRNAKKWARTALESRSSELDTGPIVNLGMACYELHEEEDAYKHFDAAYSFGKERAFKERPKKYISFYLDKSQNNRKL